MQYINLLISLTKPFDCLVICRAILLYEHDEKQKENAQKCIFKCVHLLNVYFMFNVCFFS